MRPTRAEIHLPNFLSNLSLVRDRVGAETKIMAIVKANAYGHGLEIIARAALESGEVFAFGVATEEEGVRLRKITSRPILVLTTILDDEIDVLLSHDLDITLADPEHISIIAARARALGTKARLHLKVDTGMRRVGVRPEFAIGIMRQILQETDALELTGLSTHFATSDELDHTFFDTQLERFNAVISEARRQDISIPLIHAANSGAILQAATKSAFTMVRPGIMLYGYSPSNELDELYGDLLKPVLELVSSIAFHKEIEANEGVSYNHRWKSEQRTRLLTIPVGYGDGYPRSLTNRTDVIIRQKRYPVVGTICMDQLMVNAEQDDIRTGEKVKLISTVRSEITAWTLARTIGTIPYEILTNISQRVPRIVKEDE
jgi:alanine racemase